MKIRIFLQFMAVICALGAPARASIREAQIRIDPHHYSSAMGSEPQSQLVAQTLQRWSSSTGATPWELSLHVEAETMGRRDVSLDVDRAWIYKYGVAWGRIHPFDLSANPEGTRPWGLMGRQSPQSQGVLLGYGYDPKSLSPSPILLGWVGAHYWSDFENRDTFAWGVSATPIFLPSSGPELSLSADQSATSGRFGRRPPGYVDINATRVPIHYELDRSNILRDVVFRPQAMAHLRWKPAANGEVWFFIARAPSPKPSFDIQDYLRIQTNGVNAYAYVRPRFDERFSSGVTNRWQISRELSVRYSLYAASDKWWGYEIGADARYISLAYGSEQAWGPVGDDITTSEGRYGDQLLQGEARIPVSLFTFYSGMKSHLTQNDLWLRGGVRAKVSSDVDIDAGTDIFAGSDESYFGAWRTNDRIFVAVTWELGI